MLPNLELILIFVGKKISDLYFYNYYTRTNNSRSELTNNNKRKSSLTIQKNLLISCNVPIIKEVQCAIPRYKYPNFITRDKLEISGSY